MIDQFLNDKCFASCEYLSYDNLPYLIVRVSGKSVKIFLIETDIIMSVDFAVGKMLNETQQCRQWRYYENRVGICIDLREPSAFNDIIDFIRQVGEVEYEEKSTSDTST